jgi:methylthioribose-1-phosphate isomerase
MERAIIEGAAGGFRSIELNADDTVSAIDQTLLPFEFRIAVLRSSDDCLRAIKDMVVRGAPLIGAAAAFGLFLAAKEAPAELWDRYLRERAAALLATRPTAVNLERALSSVLAAALAADSRARAEVLARAEALRIAEEDADRCRMIGLHGLELIKKVFELEGRRVNVLTHCNAGALACVDFGTATAPIYAAQAAGIPVHVWVDETRPRNQGASLTAWELGRRGVAHTLICDNTGGHLMQHGMVDLVITGADRVAASGDAANKIGTYLKALAARDNGVPFYVALPSSSFDWSITDGIAEIPIEERSPEEVRYVEGLHHGERTRVLICPEATDAANYGFDVTPARLIDGLVTERGICAAEAAAIAALFPEGAT